MNVETNASSKSAAADTVDADNTQNGAQRPDERLLPSIPAEPSSAPNDVAQAENKGRPNYNNANKKTSLGDYGKYENKTGKQKKEKSPKLI